LYSDCKYKLKQNRGSFSSYTSQTHKTVSGALIVEKETTHNSKTVKQQCPCISFQRYLPDQRNSIPRWKKFVTRLL
jgi:hypothetical protein